MNSSRSPAEPHDLPAQLVELQHQLTFQQQAFDELNTVVLDQQLELERLRSEIKSFSQLLRGLVDRGVGEDLPHEKPPHY